MFDLNLEWSIFSLQQKFLCTETIHKYFCMGINNFASYKTGLIVFFSFFFFFFFLEIHLNSHLSSCMNKEEFKFEFRISEKKKENGGFRPSGISPSHYMAFVFVCLLT